MRDLLKELAEAFDPRTFAEHCGLTGHTSILGLRYHDHGPDWAEMLLPFNPSLARDAGGSLSNGPIVTLMDIAASMAVWLKAGRFHPHATLDLRLDYVRPPRPFRDLVGRGECYALTSDLAFVRGQAHDGEPDQPVASLSGTFMIMGGK